MRTSALVVLLAATVQGNPFIEDPSLTGTRILMIWPTARSAALAGAMTGLADEADATYFNPAGLAFQPTAKADVTHSNWLPGLYPGMYYESAAGGAPLRLSFLSGRNAYLAGSATYLTVGETDVVNEHGEFLGRYCVWRSVVSLSAAMRLAKLIGVGLTLKSIHVHLTPDWIWGWQFGEADGSGNALACDIGMLWRPSARLSLGANIANLGPAITYARSGEHDPLPAMLRLGACWTPVQTRDFSLRVLPELDKLLVGMFRDTTGRKPLGRQLQEEWNDVRKAAGIEATIFRLVSLRLGYFEDVTNQLGGIVTERDWQTYHYSVCDFLFRGNLGRFKSIGLCWGIGIGTSVLRFDLSSDAAIYDFPTKNWKFQLTCNDIGRLFGRRS